MSYISSLEMIFLKFCTYVGLVTIDYEMQHVKLKTNQLVNILTPSGNQFKYIWSSHGRSDLMQYEWQFGYHSVILFSNSVLPVNHSKYNGST